MKTGELILYTSGDSVFQIAAHNDICNIENLYKICNIARKHCDKYNIGRVIARPFKGTLGNFVRTYDRKDFGIKPPGDTILNLLFENNISTYGIGKIMDLFGTEYLSQYVHTEGDEHGLKLLLEEVLNGENQFIFVNLVDLDMLYGHREDPIGYYDGLKVIDFHLEKIIKNLNDDDLLLISGDHGTDPTDGDTDHSREYVPLIAYTNNSKKNYLGDLIGFYNVGKTIADYFKIENELPGESFLSKI
jgi:phosphopentomutase